MLRVYLAGPVSGPLAEGLDYKAPFAAAVDTLRGRGVEPVNPTDLDLGPDVSWDDYMRATQDLQLTCSAIYLLPGWRDSRGATVEYWVARALGHRIYGSELP
ncbi:MAG: DUF4406 domain-containing protein [Tessaracoccus sp.]|uniref:DUF4406 domain-containing protein n=1 Tax=Tessaracoccus sp. TaxID=1971211 RepID=UPI001EB8E896|nr:DUF4406 domain-containing protein [Tessaracoccus sp.]MBK7822849.1 DUF4406 domain-containing protein [Tessaracoccus sp.]